jgi:hypothetical protein
VALANPMSAFRTFVDVRMQCSFRRCRRRHARGS